MNNDIKMILAGMLIVLAGTAKLYAEENWPSFQNGGTNTNAIKSLPSSWSADNGVAWKFEIEGYGQSSPVIAGDLIYLTSVSGDKKQKLIVTAVDLKTGKKAWQHEWTNSTPEKSSAYISRAAPSPVCDENGVVAFFEGGNLVALDPAGKVRWELDLVDKFGGIKARHGVAASPTQDKDHVYIWVERSEDPYVLKVAKKDGSVVWKSKGLGTTSWSSPRLVDVGDQQQLVISAGGIIAGYDRDSGKQLWTFDDIANNTSQTPVPVGNGRFLIGAGTARGQASGNPALNNGLIEIKKQTDGSFEAQWVWRCKKATSSFGSPLAYDGKAYFVNSVGAVYCLDLKTGKQVYVGRSPSGSVWATPIGIGERVYFFGKDGRTAVVKSGSEFEILERNVLFEKPDAKDSAPPSTGQPPAAQQVQYAAAALEGRLLIRTGNTLYAIGK